MKRFLVLGILFAFLSAGLVFSQTAEENFEKAAQAELSKREAILLEKAAEIESFHANMADDGVITGKEMKTLDKMINDFGKTEKKFDKELEFYGKSTQVEISAKIRAHRGIYFKGSSTYCDSKKQEIRQYFVEKTGVDVIVEKTKSIAARVFMGFIIGLIVALCLIVFIQFSTKSDVFSVVAGIIAFFTVLTLFIVL